MILALISVLSILSGSATSAWAYVPPSQFIARTLAKKHTGYKNIQVRSQVTAMEKGVPTQTRFRDLTLFNTQSGTLRSWAMDESGRVLYETERPARSLSPVSSVLFETNGQRLVDHLKSSGIPLSEDTNSNTAEKTTMLSRWNRAVVWVIGATAKNKGSSPQLWVEKDSFFPLRVIAAGRGSSDLIDFQMENFKIHDEFAYPRSSTMFEAGAKEPLLKADLMDLTLDSTAEHPKEKADGFTDAGKAASSDLRDLIKNYYRFAR